MCSVWMLVHVLCVNVCAQARNVCVCPWRRACLFGSVCAFVCVCVQHPVRPPSRQDSNKHLSFSHTSHASSSLLPRHTLKPSAGTSRVENKDFLVLPFSTSRTFPAPCLFSVAGCYVFLSLRLTLLLESCGLKFLVCFSFLIASPLVSQ